MDVKPSWRMKIEAAQRRNRQVRKSNFEQLAERLGVQHEEEWAMHAEIRAFARREKDRKYVPEALLHKLGLEVNFKVTELV